MCYYVYISKCFFVLRNLQRLHILCTPVKVWKHKFKLPLGFTSILHITKFFYSSFNKIDKWKEQFHLFAMMNGKFFCKSIHTTGTQNKKTFKSCPLSLPLINVRLSVWMTRWSVRTQAQEGKNDSGDVSLSINNISALPQTQAHWNYF